LTPEQREQRKEEQRAARVERRAEVEEEIAGRRAALEERRLSPEDDLRQRLVAVADELHLDVVPLWKSIVEFKELLGGGGRRFDAREVVDSLRNRIRNKQTGQPRYGDLEGLVLEMIVEQNQVAMEMMRAHLTREGAAPPHAVLGVERGGAFLAEVLSTGLPGSPDIVAVPKHVEKRPGQPDLVQRTPGLDAEIRRRIEVEGQSRFTIVDFYMGGVFAGELRTMIIGLLHDHPQLEIEVLWMREAHGFERVVFRPGRKERSLQPMRTDLEEGVAFAGGVQFVDQPPPKSTGPGIASVLPIPGPPRFVRLGQESPAVILPALKGTEKIGSQTRVTQFPVDMVLGDDMRAVLDRSPTKPIEIFDREGNIVQRIPVGTPDPDTGHPLKTTRDIMVRLMQGAKFTTARPTPEGEE
jgi:hypothetical protein